MRIPLFLSTLSFALLVACKASVPADAATPAAVAPAPAQVAPVAATPAAPTAPQAPAIDQGFTKGMAYADLRRQVLAAGWLPLSDPSCRENIGGTATICFELPELEACSGDGRCNMHFADAVSGREIAVHTYGPVGRWNTAGEEKTLAVQGWDVSTVAPAKREVACPSQDFDTFLKRYASDDAVRRAYTAPLVQVAVLGGGEDGDEAVQTYMRGDRYDAFAVQYRDGWVMRFAQSGGAPAAARIAVTEEPAGTRLVTLPGNIEGISYRFAQKDGCWWLVSDPDVVP